MPQSQREDHRFVTQESLIRRWQNDHKLLMHMEQKQQMLKDTYACAPEFKAKQCLKLGVCVCGSKGSVATSFCSKLSKYFRKYFGTKKAKSPEILAWQKGMYVVSLSNNNGDHHDETQFFFHVGHTDFRTWEMCVLRLLKRHHNPIDQSILLQVGGVGDTERLDIRMLLEFMKSDDIDLDLSQHCYVQLYRIVNGRSLVPADFMRPCYVTIKRESDAVCIWDGPGPKTRGHKRKHNRKQQQPNRGRQRNDNPDNAAGNRNNDNADNADDDDGAGDGTGTNEDSDPDLFENIDIDTDSDDETNESEIDIDQLCNDLLSEMAGGDNDDGDLQNIFGDDDDGDDEQAAQDAVFEEIDFQQLGLEFSDSDTDLPVRGDDVGILNKE